MSCGLPRWCMSPPPPARPSTEKPCQDVERAGSERLPTTYTATSDGSDWVPAPARIRRRVRMQVQFPHLICLSCTHIRRRPLPYLENDVVSVTKFNLIVCLCTKPTSRAYKGLVHIRYPLSELPPASSLEMTSSYPSSNHATHGSVTGPAQDTLPPFSSNSSAASSTTATDQQALSTARTSAYLDNPTASHIQHRHRSAQQAEASHTADMKAYLNNFDATMAKHEK
ncbi:hypothetical protein V8E51_019024 [Hyaloscypha variabilis]